MAAAAIAFSSGDSQAAEDCGGLDTALQNNLNFIAGQQANPDAQSAARIANRQAVVDLIQQRRKAAGCTKNVTADAAAAVPTTSGENCAGLDQALKNNLNFIAGQQAKPDAQSAARIANRQAVVDLIQQRRKAAGCTADVKADNGNATPPADNSGGANTDTSAAKPPTNDDNASGSVVCAGSTVTLSGEGGAPAASSNQFPAGTKLKVTNLDNNKSTTVQVTSVSGSCALLNNAAFEQVREPGKFLIRHVRIERVG
nr:septal ring lytic transglycosylase RlpA family protein [Actinocrispum wychmicini]